MPKVIKKRVPKSEHDAPEIEEIQSLFSKVFEERRKAVLSAVGVILALAVIGTAWTLVSYNRMQKAAELEATAVAAFYAAETVPAPERDAAYRKALESFSEAANVLETPTTMFYLAESHLKLGETDEALKAFGQFLSVFDDSPLMPAVAGRVAQLHRAADRTDDALGSLQPVKDAVVGGDTALADMAKILEASGRNEEALGLLKSLVASYPASPWAAEAQAKVQPPEPAPAETTTDGTETGMSTGEPAAASAETTAKNKVGESE